jgi:demethylmenaquinone methyltransferase/2-methoxy-6-polyprenyl-1,4-benzoquinol methylase
MKKGLTLNMHDYIHCPEGKLKYNREMFTEITPKYDFITRVLSLGRDSVWKDRLIKQLPDIKAPDCLDLACGTGDITFRLAAKYPAGRITGLDLTETMVALAKLRDRFDNVTFTIQNMCELEFGDNSFDIVTGGYALRNAPSLIKALTEIRRVMKPGGTGAFLDFSKPPNHFFQKTEDILLRSWGGFWGLVLHRNPQIYTYIAESLKQFPDAGQLKECIAKLGFGNIRCGHHYFGIAETIIFEKI